MKAHAPIASNANQFPSLFTNKISVIRCPGLAMRGGL